MKEFKVGDEVRVLKMANGGDVPVGTIGVITSVGKFGAVRVGTGGMFNYFLGGAGGKIELVKTEPVYPNPPHSHQKLIIEWADGADIQRFGTSSELWDDVTTPAWNPNVKYRVKPDVTTVDPRLELLNEKLAELHKAVAYVKKEIGEL